MILPEDFKVFVDWVDDGPLVRVRHEPSGWELERRPSATESVGDVKDVLLRCLKDKFFKGDEWRWGQFQAVFEDGRRGTIYRLSHLPSGKTRSARDDELAALGVLHSVKERWADEIAEELWQEGYFTWDKAV